jgi:hypothetical protein
MTNQNQTTNPASSTPNPAGNPQTPVEKQGENKPASAAAEQK